MKNTSMIIFSISTILLLLQTIVGKSQVYSIGHKSITYTDPARSNRSVPCEIYYPSNTAGENTPIANGQFPLVVFGHGFVMGFDAYQIYWDSIVPKGYIMVFPTTEGSIFPTPNHLTFGLDLAFAVTKMQTEGNLSSSFFYQKIATTSAILGHSMGGKCSVIASSNNTNITTTVSFGMSNSNSPDAILNYAPSVTVPAIVFSGANDCVAVPADNQVPLYNALGSQCKTFISVTGGSHCQFAESNFNCNFGESTCSPSPTITRDEQYAEVFSLLLPYLDFMLKNNSSAEALFINRLSTNTGITYLRNCLTSTNNIKNIDNQNFTFNPNPVENFVKFEMLNIKLPIQLIITDMTGRKILSDLINYTHEIVNLLVLESGTYLVHIDNVTRILIKR
ncbi:MAG: T9SS type A sorting domain-containing protein [Bacteroidia bacterium]|nr:T9SS type A sorting domain-containing protein [Bacteroidia bacterium]